MGYCQGLNFVAALFLLATGREGERAFWLLAALVGHVLAPNTYASNLAGCHSEMRTLAVLLSRRMPRLHRWGGEGAGGVACVRMRLSRGRRGVDRWALRGSRRHLESLGCDVSIVATDWFLCLFTTSLPPEVAARVWDVLLNEGSKVRAWGQRRQRLLVGLCANDCEALRRQGRSGQDAQRAHGAAACMRTHAPPAGAVPSFAGHPAAVRADAAAERQLRQVH